MMRMLEGERYKANEIYNDFKFIIGEIEDIAKNNSAYLSNIYSIFSLFKQKRLMGVVDLSQRGYQGWWGTLSNCVQLCPTGYYEDITRI